MNLKIQPVSLNHAILGRKDILTGSNFPFDGWTAMPMIGKIYLEINIVMTLIRRLELFMIVAQWLLAYTIQTQKHTMVIGPGDLRTRGPRS